MKIFRYQTDQGHHGGEGIIIALNKENAFILLTEYTNKLDKEYLPESYDPKTLKSRREPIKIILLFQLPLKHEELLEFEDGMCC